ncbi:MAG TPA: hypothetical protein VFQ05_15510 [Candidatus Eisenbacteria bacterium]|nr:hypothetical protein [Candidatus Eisenbacteria bacterium]
MEGRRETPGTMLWVTGTALLLSVFTVYLHLKELGRAYVLEYQVPRHLAMLAGTAGNPWQYRVFSAWVVEGFHQALATVGIHDPLIAAFIAVRVLAETAMFIVAWRYWRSLDLSSAASFMGLALLGWSVSYSNFGSDLQFNTYFDVLFYLVAGWLVVRGRLGWLLPLTAVAALNRETSGFIPLLALATWPGATREARGHALRMAAAGILIYAVMFIGLRLSYGKQELIVPYGHEPGLDLFMYNLTRARTWVQLVGTFSILPFMALAARSRWPAWLRSFFWMLVPAWLLVHWFGAVMSETRLLLVPLALAILPAALFLLPGEVRREPARV